MQEQKKNESWGEFEEFFATAVINQANRSTKRWFFAWMVTTVVLLFTNAVWISIVF